MAPAKNVRKVTKFSQDFYVQWLNEKFNTHIEGLSELGDGKAYTLLFHKLFPKKFNISKLSKMSPLKIWESIAKALEKLEVQKTVRVEELSSGQVMEHCYFISWFKEFYEHNEKRYAKIEYLLAWISRHSGVKSTKLEDLSSGLSYCILTRKIYPKAMNITRIKIICEDEKCREKNLMVLNKVFERIKADIRVPVVEVSQLKQKPCLEFLASFKQFYEISYQVHMAKQDEQRNQSGAVMMAIVDAATHVQQVHTSVKRNVANLLGELEADIKAVKTRDTGVGGLFRHFKEKYEYIMNLMQNKIQEDVVIIDDLHELDCKAELLLNMSKVDSKLVPKNIQKVIAQIVPIIDRIIKFVVENLIRTKEIVEDVTIHGNHPLKDLFYSMKYKHMTAVEAAKKERKSRSRGIPASEGTVTQMWYCLCEAVIISDEIKDHVDFMQRGRMRRGSVAI